jgi:hypothetical protein
LEHRQGKEAVIVFEINEIIIIIIITTTTTTTATTTTTTTTTPWSRILLENLIITQLVKKFSALYGTRKFMKCS